MRNKEREVINRDKVITELRLRMPADAHRDELILKATMAAEQRADPTAEDYEGQQAVRVAQSTVHSLQVGDFIIVLCISTVSILHVYNTHYKHLRHSCGAGDGFYIE